MVRQAKGRKHLKNIKRKAMRLWKVSHYQKGLWDQCLKAVIERHRQKVEDEIKAKIRDQETDRQREMEFCDRNGWLDSMGCC